MPSLKLKELYTYLEDMSSDDDFFDSLEVHLKVTPRLMVRIHHDKGQFYMPPFQTAVLQSH